MKDLEFKPVLKRVAAYMIDILIVLILGTLVSSVKMINKNMDEYQDLYAEYQKLYTEYTDTVKSLNESYSDKKITQEEYDKLIKTEKYKQYFEGKYQDLEITKDEYSKILSEMEESYSEEIEVYNYNLQKVGIYNSIITLVCTLLYFGIIQYFFHGQTIGKRLFNLKVVSANDKKINIFNFILRSLIVNDILLNTINLILLFTISKASYLKATNIVELAISLVEAVIIFLVITRKDHRGLHDLLFNTKVISTKEEVQEKNAVVDARYEEREVKKNAEKRKNNH